jgi:hypothetical protein
MSFWRTRLQRRQPVRKDDLDTGSGGFSALLISLVLIALLLWWLL